VLPNRNFPSNDHPSTTTEPSSSPVGSYHRKIVRRTGAHPGDADAYDRIGTLTFELLID
jgi:hypothetical protein